MAKSWKIARSKPPCGSEFGCWINEHQPYLAISGQGWIKVRCERHAGEVAPEVIEPEPELWLRPAFVSSRRRPSPIWRRLF